MIGRGAVMIGRSDWARAGTGVALAAMVLGLAAGPGHAEEPERDRRAQAERLFRGGERAYESGQYLAAARAFEKSYELLPVPEIAFSMAQAYRLQYFADKQPRWLERAIELYRGYVEEVARGGRRSVAITHLAQLEPMLLRIESRGRVAGADAGDSRATEVLITSPTPGARVSVEGTISDLPVTLRLEPGDYEAKLSAPGHAPVQRTITAVEGEFVDVEVALVARPARIDVEFEDDATISIDGRPVGTTPLIRPIEVDAGVHFVAVTRRGFRPWTRELTMGRGEEVELVPKLHRTGQRKASYMVLGFAGAALLGAGMTTLVAAGAGGRASELLRIRDERGLTGAEYAEYQQQRDRRNGSLVATYILFSIATGAGLTGGLLYLLDDQRATSPPRPQRRGGDSRDDGDRASLSLVPVVAPGAAGVAALGRF